MKLPYNSDARLNQNGSDRFDRQTAMASGCQGKEGFTSWEDADRIIRDRRRKAKRRFTSHKQARAERATLHPYRCRFCQQWHIGNKSR